MSPQEYMNLDIDEVAKTEPPYIFISFPSKKDPNWSQHPGRESKSTCHVLTFANWEWYKEFEGTPPDECGGKYKDIVDQYTNLLLEMLYKSYPQVKGRIEHMNVFTPLTNHHHLGRKNGEGYGFSHSQGRYSPIPSVSE
jgi:all-trans-retinol 13,14-reductase